MKKFLIALVIIAAAVGVGIYVYQDYQREKEMRDPKFYSGNGRFEATEVYISSRLGGKIAKIYVNEGDLVKKGDKLVEMDTKVLLAQKAATLANIKVQQGELAMAKATVKQKESAFSGAEKEFLRNKSLLASKAVSQKLFEQAETAYNTAKAELEYAKASVIAAEGRIAVQQAELQRIEADIIDSTLIAEYEGRIQYKLAREGEVIAAGGRAMNLVNLTDSYMTFFLPTNVAGKVQIGAEVKLLFDVAPNDPLDAKVTYIDPVAQFTPKSVETKVEREKLMFRIKANVNADLLRKYISSVKTGLPGVAWIKLDPNAKWEDSPLKDLQPIPVR